MVQDGRVDEVEVVDGVEDDDDNDDDYDRNLVLTRNDVAYFWSRKRPRKLIRERLGGTDR